MFQWYILPPRLLADNTLYRTGDAHRLMQSFCCGRSCQFFFFLVSWGGEVKLSPFGTWATIWLIVPASDDRRSVWSSRWVEIWQGKPKYSEKTCPTATLSTTNPTWPYLLSNPGRRGGKPTNNSLNYKVFPNPNFEQVEIVTGMYIGKYLCVFVFRRRKT
jgi:hypothetical protein